jgi:hypothetical protein
MEGERKRRRESLKFTPPVGVGVLRVSDLLGEMAVTKLTDPRTRVWIDALDVARFGSSIRAFYFVVSYVLAIVSADVYNMYFRCIK